jgi:four helix bundle protein
MLKSFRDLEVWNLSMDLTIQIYAVTSEFPKHEIYGLSSQMRRAAVSTPSNIAEGSVRSTRKDFRQFVLIARGSNSELQTQLMIAHRLGYGLEPQVDEALRLSQQVGRMLSGLSRFLKTKPTTNPTPTNNQQPTTNNQQLTTNN